MLGHCLEGHFATRGRTRYPGDPQAGALPAAFLASLLERPVPNPENIVDGCLSHPYTLPL